MLVYKSENPRAFKNVCKKNLPVIWKANKKAWVTSALFSEWFNSHFCPAVKEYCRKNNLSNKALLILDKAPGHPLNLDTDSIKVIFLPPNTTSLLQPMDQGVIASFKAYYLRRTFQQLVKTIDRNKERNMSVQQFWKQYTILNAIKNINNSWNEVTASNMKKAWKKLLPELITSSPVEDDELEQIRREILNMGNSVGYPDLNEQDISNLITSHDEPLSNEELFEILEEEEHIATLANTARPPDYSEREQDSKQMLTKQKLSEVFKLFDEAADILKSCDEDADRVNLFSQGLNNLLIPYKELFKEKQRNSLKQPKILSFLESSSTHLQSSTEEI